ncbi:MAG: hypothetical protein PHY56_05385 [Candidatus Omnitrophica bacterium]|nr:hypothetical protein [Candidatus Omnitrophota bacterium]
MVSSAAQKKKIAEEGINKELATLEIILAAKIDRTSITLAEYIQMRLSQGATLEVIRADLLADLEEGGRIFGEFKNALQPTFAGSTGRFRDIGELAETGISKTFRWVAVLVNTCPDCLERHNQVKTWAEWEEEGLPRSGATVCGQNCKCVLVSAEATALEPIVRG